MPSVVSPVASLLIGSVRHPLTSPLTRLTHPHRISLGPINVMIPASLVTGVLTFAWPYTHETAALVTVAVIYGASSGTVVALISAPMMALGDSADVGRRTGMYFTIASLGSLSGPPISGAINHSTGGYRDVGIFAGA
jgi:MCP family monocarboxylic acid transporter-like MFS transporter 10